MRFSAVITAGGRVTGEFAQGIGTDIKALAKIRGRTMLARAIESARAAGADRIAVVGGTEVANACRGGVERIIDESMDGGQNIRHALGAWGNASPILYLTSDMPYLESTALVAFANRIPDGTLAIALTEIDDFERRFPGAPPFGVRIGRDQVVNGGAFLIPPRAIEATQRFATRFFEARKSVPAMVSLLGPVLALQFALRRLTIPGLEAHAKRLLGVPARAVRNCAPELAYDVDTFEEYRYAAAHA